MLQNLKRLLHIWTTLFDNPVPNKGAVLESINPNHAQLELIKPELFAGAAPVEAIDWYGQFPPNLHYQDGVPTCVGQSLAFLQEYNELLEDVKVKLSARSTFMLGNGDVSVGMSVSAALEVARKIGIPPEEFVPETYHKADYVPPLILPLGIHSEASKYRIKNWAFVPIDKLDYALQTSPIIIIVGGNNQDWQGGTSTITHSGRNDWYHAVVCSGRNQRGDYHIANWWHKEGGPYWGLKGWGWLDASYPVLYAFAVVDLPDDWKERQQEAVVEDFEQNAKRWGMVNNPDAEVRADVALRDAILKAFKNKSQKAPVDLWVSARWYRFVNAIAYGGYSVTDIINYLWAKFVKGQGDLFDFNKQRI